jgi:hypothetical protein
VDGGGRDAAAGEVVATAEIVVLSLRPVEDYSVGPCWWVGACGGNEVLGETGLPVPIPAEFELVDERQTELFDVRVYRAPRPVELAPAGFGGTLVQSPS